MGGMASQEIIKVITKQVGFDDGVGRKKQRVERRLRLPRVSNSC